MTELVLQPAVVRNTTLRERGSSAVYDRFRPLAAAQQAVKLAAERVVSGDNCEKLGGAPCA